jgi:hypothetical protein
VEVVRVEVVGVEVVGVEVVGVEVVGGEVVGVEVIGVEVVGNVVGLEVLGDSLGAVVGFAVGGLGRLHPSPPRNTRSNTSPPRNTRTNKNVPSPRNRNHEEPAGAETHLLGSLKVFDLGEATFSQVKANRNKLARMYHPDKHKSEMTGLTQEGAKQYMQVTLREDRERSRGERENFEEIESQTRTWSQDLYFDEQEREAISLSHQHATGANQSNGSTHTNARTCSNQAASISALFDCVSMYLLNQGFSSEGQERRYVKAKKKSLAKNAVPACVVPLSFLAKGKREERVVI